MLSQLTEEPEALHDSGDVTRAIPELNRTSSGTGPSVQDGPPEQSGTLGMKWDGDQWTDEIVKQ